MRAGGSRFSAQQSCRLTNGEPAPSYGQTLEVQLPEA